MFTNDLLKERNLLKLNQEHHLNQLRVSDNPSGILLPHKHGKYFKWRKRYLQDGIPITADLRKKEGKEAERLAANLYHMVCIVYLQDQIQAIDSFRRRYSSGPGIKKTDLGRANTGMMQEESERNTIGTEIILRKLLYRVRNYPLVPADFFSSGSPYRAFILTYLQNEYAGIIDWYLGQFVQNTEHPERLQFPVKLGYKVRSKSEMMAADRLYDEGILFHYDERLVLQDGEAAFPDFLIPFSAYEVHIWEHFGAMDKEKYYNRTRGKIHDYLDNQWYPGINMITTYETRQDPLTEEKIDQKIRWLKNRYRLVFADLPPDESFNLYDLAAYVKQCRAGK